VSLTIFILFYIKFQKIGALTQRARSFNTLFKAGAFNSGAPTPEKEKSKAMQTIEGKLMVAIKVKNSNLFFRCQICIFHQFFIDRKLRFRVRNASISMSISWDVWRDNCTFFCRIGFLEFWRYSISCGYHSTAQRRQAFLAPPHFRSTAVCVLKTYPCSKQFRGSKKYCSPQNIPRNGL
jgi:hypothetical protein